MSRALVDLEHGSAAESRGNKGLSSPQKLPEALGNGYSDGYSWIIGRETVTIGTDRGGEMSEQGQAFDAKREVYEAARAERDWIIDHPDRSIPLSKYKQAIRDAQEKCRLAHREMLEAWT